MNLRKIYIGYSVLLFGLVCALVLTTIFNLAGNRNMISFAQTLGNTTTNNSKIITNSASINFPNSGHSGEKGTDSTSFPTKGYVDIIKTGYPDLSKTNQTEVVIQNTSMSAPAPVRHPGQPSHEVVFALPLRTDNKIWQGTVTFTASKPIEVEILHTYSPIKTPDAIHREPYHAVLPGNKSIAITHLRNLVDVPIEIEGVGISSGTLNFVGNALLFHKTSGEPFTVTYTIDANLKNLTFKQ
jgi:hypothetical protein